MIKYWMLCSELWNIEDDLMDKSWILKHAFSQTTPLLHLLNKYLLHMHMCIDWRLICSVFSSQRWLCVVSISYSSFLIILFIDQLKFINLQNYFQLEILINCNSHSNVHRLLIWFDVNKFSIYNFWMENGNNQVVFGRE